MIPTYWRNGLSRLIRRDQHLVFDGFGLTGRVEQGSEGGGAGSPAVQAEDELVEVGLEVLRPQAVIDAERPSLVRRASSAYLSPRT